MIERRKTRQLHVGSVAVGGDAPIAVQSMTNTHTDDAAATLEQIQRLADAGCDIIRCAVPDMAAAEGLKTICKESPVPVIADIHFDYKLALAAIEAGVDGLRLNPGNIGGEEKVRAVVEAAKERNIPIRIGVNAGRRICWKNTAIPPRRLLWRRLGATCAFSKRWITVTLRFHSKRMMCR